jgi:hypothetical protein
MSIKEWYKIKPLEQTKAIEKIEQDYRVCLSSKLKDCILTNNGGRPRPNVVKLDNGQEYDVKLLLSYNENDLETIYKVIRFFADKFGGKVVPFATDSGGNYYCEYEGRIVLWIQDDIIIPICDSFETFLQMLTEI